MKKRRITVKKLNVKECPLRAFRDWDAFLNIRDAAKQQFDEVRYSHYPYPKSL